MKSANNSLMNSKDYPLQQEPCTVHATVTEWKMPKVGHALRAAGSGVREIKIHDKTYYLDEGLSSSSPKNHMKTYEAARQAAREAQHVVVWSTKKNYSWLDIKALIEDALCRRFKVQLSVTVDNAELAETMLRYLKPSSVPVLPGSQMALIPSLESRARQFMQGRTIPADCEFAAI